MKLRYLLLCLGMTVLFPSCLVTESIVFNEDGSGDFNVIYDLSNMSEQMGLISGPTADDDMNELDDEREMDDKDKLKTEELEIEAENKKTVKEDTPEKVMDTLVYFDDMMVQYKDSISKLPENERKALEALKGMYMTIKNDDAKGIFEMGVGMKFNAIDDLKDIQKKVESAKTMNSKDFPLDAMSDESSMGGALDVPDSDVVYSFDTSKFSRVTTILNPDKLNTEVEAEKDPDEFESTMKEAIYMIKYTFPRKIKSVSAKDAEISEDGKTVSFYANWMDYIKNPLLLDVEIELEDE